MSSRMNARCNVDYTDTQRFILLAAYGYSNFIQNVFYFTVSCVSAFTKVPALSGLTGISGMS